MHFYKPTIGTVLESLEVEYTILCILTTQPGPLCPSIASLQYPGMWPMRTSPARETGSRAAPQSPPSWICPRAAEDRKSSAGYLNESESPGYRVVSISKRVESFSNTGRDFVLGSGRCGALLWASGSRANRDPSSHSLPMPVLQVATESLISHQIP